MSTLPVSRPLVIEPMVIDPMVIEPMVIEPIVIPTLNQWADECFGTTARHGLMNLAPNTIKGYRYTFDKFLRPYNFPLDIDRRTVQRFIAGHDAPRDKKLLAILSTLLTYAVDFDILERNICTRIKTKKYIRQSRLWVPFDSLTNYGNDQNPTKYNRHVRFMASTGMRYAEALALTSQDIDRAEQTGWLVIDKSIHGTTKSGLARQVPYIGFGTTFPKSRQFQTCFGRTHGQGYTIHSLRYTYAHMLKTRGVHPTVAQRLLGHSTITLTLGLYTGVLDTELDQAKKALLNVRWS